MGGSGGAPIRYEFTGRGRKTISPWTNSSYTYSLLQLNLANNPLSNLEVASTLNTLNIGAHMYAYSLSNCTSRYYPKVYIGTAQTLGIDWNFDQQTGINYPSNWPEVKPQKGEANIQYVDK